MSRSPKAYAYGDIDKRKFKTIEIEEDEWKEHLGEPELGNSSWFIFGESGDGKTSYALQVAKMLCNNGYKVHYNTLEEGMKQSFKLALKEAKMQSVKENFSYQQEKLPELSARLSRKRQPKIVIIDSAQYFFRGMRTQAYFDFIQQFKDTTFIWMSGAEGKTPIGKVAQDIYYDADICIQVKDFQAVVRKNRFRAYQNRIIWQQGYNDRQMILLQKG